MEIEQRESRSITALCSLLGYSRQAYYQQKRQSEKISLQYDFLIKEILEIRKNQKRLGGRKLLYKLEPFMSNHHIEIGRDSFFNLLSENNLLVRKRKRRKPKITFSDHWMRKYPNLIEGFYPTAPNQLWVSDINVSFSIDCKDFLGSDISFFLNPICPPAKGPSKTIASGTRLYFSDQY